MKKPKSLLSITLPIFLELFLVTVVGNVDTYMLSKFSEKAVGAVGEMSQVLDIQNIILSFICLGSTILTAQFIGAQKEEAIKEVIASSLIMNLALSSFLGITYVVFARFILLKIKLPSELIDLGINYFRIVGGFCIFQSMTLASSAILKGHGNTKPMLFINVGVNILNIIGNGMFIFGWFGAPILGVTGVGISTVVSRGIGAIVALFVMFRYCSFKFEHINLLRMSNVKKILSIGIPTAGENLTWNITQLIILSTVNILGEKTITARIYLFTVSKFVMTMSIALGHGTAIQVGQLIGAEEKEKAYTRCLKSLKISFIAAIAISIGVIIFRRPIINIFTTDKEVVDIALKVFPWFLYIETGRTFNIVVINALHAAGDINFPMLMGCIVMLGVAAPLSYLFGINFGWGLVGVWIANGTDEWIRGFAMLWRWRSRKWENKGFVKKEA